MDSISLSKISSGKHKRAGSATEIDNFDTQILAEVDVQTSYAILFLENLKLKLVNVLEQVHGIIANLLN